MENKLTFEDDDTLGRKDFAAHLTDGISTLYPFADGAYVLSLNAPFGSGKTHFLNMWENYLRNDYTVIRINAWEDDFAENPIIPIISALLDNLSENAKATPLVESLKNCLGALVDVANQVIESHTQLNTKKLIKAGTQALKNDTLDTGSRLYQEFSARKTAFQKMRDSLTKYVEELQNRPLFILVDELDRARPDYAVDFLETIKHFFSVNGVVFVLAINRQQLEASVKTLFGEQTVFDEYYRKFITAEVDLPSPPLELLGEYIEAQYERFFTTAQKAGIFFASAPDEAVLLQQIKLVCALFAFTPRITEAFLRKLMQYLAVSKKDSTFRPGWIKASILLIGLQFYDKDFYHKIGSDKVDGEQAIQFFFSLDFNQFGYDAGNYKRSFIYHFFLFLLNSQSVAGLLRVFKDNFESQISYETLTSDFHKYLRDSGISLKERSTFSSLYRKVESLQKLFAD